MNLPNAPRCGQCGVQYVWDWELDCYREVQTGKPADEGTTMTIPFAGLAELQLNLDTADASWFTPSPTTPVELEMYRCIRCETTIGGLVHHADFGVVVAKRADWPAWKDLDWETLAWENE